MMQPGDTVGGRFAIEAAAGGGGMGSIFRAADLATGATVALKVLRSDLGDASRFERESKVLSSLEHPAVVRYVAHGLRPDGSPWLAMEWLAGEDLATRLTRSPLTAVESLSLCARAAQGLAAAHALGVVHRDVKPANLLLVDGDPLKVKVLDFGIARRVDRATRAATGTGMLLGTPGYMAPEQARGDRDIDRRADLYALGCVLYECLTGAPAFRADNPLALLASVLLADPPRLRDAVPDAPEALDALVTSLLAKDPSERPDDATELALRLTELARVEAESGPRLVAPRPSSSLSTGERRVLCAVLAVDPTIFDTPPIAPDFEAAPTASLGPDLIARGQLEGLRARYLGPEARVECLADGTVIFASQGATSAETARAARLALALQTALPGRVIVLAAGHGTHASRNPLGAVIERAVSLARLRPDGVVLDENAAALLHDRCRLRMTPQGAVLVDDHGDDARPVLGVSTPCVGRERELALLGATFAECAADEVARAVIVTAVAGAGKSRLRREFLATLAAKDEPPRVWSARADVLAADSPLAPLGALIRSAAGIVGSSTQEAERAALAALAGRYCADDARRTTLFLAELAGLELDPEGDAALIAARHDPKLMFEQTRGALVRLLTGACASGPLVLVLDDAHWSDGASLLFLDHAMRELRERPLMVIAFARPEIIERFPKLWAEHTVQELRLSPLTRRACERLVQRVLGDVAPEKMARLIDRAGGNAFYLEELLRAVSSGASELPETVLAVVQARLSSLSPEARRALRAASVFGESCWSAGVEALLSEPARSTPSADLLDELCAREVLARASTSRFAGSVEYRFHHALVHAASYAMLTPEDRALGHGLAAEWLLGVGEADPLVLANHFEAAGQRARAATYLVAAAEGAVAANNSEAALVHAGRAEGLAGDDHAVIGAVALIHVQADFYAGRYESSVRRGLELMSRSTPAAPGWCHAAMIVAASMGRSRQVERLDVIEAALAAADPATVHPAADRARTGLAMEFYLEGQVARGDAQLGAITQTPEVLAAEDPAAACMFYNARATRAVAQGRLFSHASEAALGLDIAMRAGDRFLAGACYGSAVNALSQLGQNALCERRLAEAAAYCDAYGTGPLRARVVLARSAYYLAGGRLREALAEGRRAQSLLASEERRLPQAHLVVLRSLIELGETDEAARLLESLAPQLAAVPVLRAVRALLLLRTGDPAAAWTEARAARSLLEGHLRLYELFAILTAYDAAVALGDRDGARTTLAEARAAYDLIASDAPDEEARRQLGRNVVDHARLLALCS